jgi:hypothetical protein
LKDIAGTLFQHCGATGRLLFLPCFSVAISLFSGIGAADVSTKRIVLIAGPKSHGPGEHEYLKSIKLLKVLLDRAPNLRGVQTAIYFNGWPEDPEVLNRANTIAIFSDGEGGFGAESPHADFMTDEHMRVIEKQVRRGCGFVMYHHSTFSPAKYSQQILDWSGGFFDWHSGHGEGGFLVMQDGAPRLINDGPLQQWHSAIRDTEAEAVLATLQHPISQGVSPSFRFKDEYYYQLRFLQDSPNLHPILKVPELASNANDQIVAWAFQRKDGGRGFGTTTGHYFENWKNANYRRLMLNALVWSAGAPIPKGGIKSAYVDEDKVDRALMTGPIPTLYVPDSAQTSEEKKASAATIAAVLNSEIPRFRVDLAKDDAVLERDLLRYKLLVVNNCDTVRRVFPAAMTDGLLRFWRSGGGLVVVSTASNNSPATVSRSGLEGAEYRPICKEVAWQSGEEETKEDVGPVLYSVVLSNHSITRFVNPYRVSRLEVRLNLAPAINFTIEDQEHMQILASGRGGTGTNKALAFIVQHDKGRIYQVIGGQDVSSVLRSPRITQLVRYGALWVVHE